MKPNALGWLVVVAIAGCGLGGDPGQTSSNTNKLTTAPGQGTDGGSGGPSICPMPCEAEQVALKSCEVVPGAICDPERDQLKQCLTSLPPTPAPCNPPPPPPCNGSGTPGCDPCDAILEELKLCLNTTPVAQCVGLIQKYDACEAGQVTPPPPTPACFYDSEGSSTSCEATGKWKLAAEAACNAKGAELVALWTGDACGVDQFRYAKFECCTKAIPPPPPPPLACFYDSMGGPMSCETDTSWKLAAEAACNAKGTKLVTLSTGDPCGVNLFRYAKFECCQ